METLTTVVNFAEVLIYFQEFLKHIAFLRLLCYTVYTNIRIRNFKTQKEVCIHEKNSDPFVAHHVVARFGRL